jgi:phage terminase large subunit GpA-like protein
MTAATAKIAIQEGLRLAIPDGGLTVSKWAAEHRYVDRGARPGRWSNETVPFLTEIMDAVTEPDVREVVFMKSSQVGGSEVAVNIIGYFIHIDPTQIMYVGEIEDKAKAWTQESFDATVRTTPVLKRLVKLDPEDNNQRIKRFPGGQLTVIWATSPAGASSRPVQVIVFDECDAYKPTNEGDIIKLTEARTKTYSGSEKIIKISSPRNADTSEIEKSYLKGDQREFWVPCPSCDEFQTLKWTNVQFDPEDPENTTCMACESCGVELTDDDKIDMLAKGKWQAQMPFNGTASFKISQLYSPFVPWSRMVIDFLEAKKFRSTLQVWTNTALGESWKPEERIEFADLNIKREEYPAPWPNVDELTGRQLLVAPAGVLCLTAGVDTQGDRLEAEIVGWGKDHESWSIDYRVIFGDPAGTEIWEELADYLTTPVPSERGPLKVYSAAIDSGGHHTQQVYRFCKTYAQRKWFAIKGSSQPGNPLVSKPKWVGSNPKVRLFSIGTDTAKDEIFSFLQIEKPGPGYCHFPDDERYDDAYLKQLCAEKKVQRFRMGRPSYIYEKVSANARNEALDVRVYATAARGIIRQITRP